MTATPTPLRERFEHWMLTVAKCVVGSRDPYPAGIERDKWEAFKAGADAALSERDAAGADWRHLVRRAWEWLDVEAPSDPLTEELYVALVASTRSTHQPTAPVEAELRDEIQRIRDGFIAADPGGLATETDCAQARAIVDTLGDLLARFPAPIATPPASRPGAYSHCPECGKYPLPTAPAASVELIASHLEIASRAHRDSTLRDAAALIRRLAAVAPAGMDGWQPIETAPKDGTEIDVWCWDNDGCGYRITRAWWCRVDNRWRCYGDERMQWMHQPTHWMTEPAAPTPPATAGEE